MLNFAYHPTEGKKLVEDSEYYKLLEQGWFDSPAKFPMDKEVKKEVSETVDEKLEKLNKENEKLTEEISIKRRGRPAKAV